MSAAVEERFWSKVERGADDECWPWQGSIEQHGYARFWPTSDTGIMVHRFAYELANGPIPEGLVIDHLCRVPHCVNPKHLEAVTNGENVLRGEGPTAVNARKTHCKRGHEFSPENTLLSKGKRWCKTCKCEADIIRHAREREERLEAELETYDERENGYVKRVDELEAELEDAARAEAEAIRERKELEAEVEKLRERGDRWKASARERVRRAQQAEAKVEKLRKSYRQDMETVYLSREKAEAERDEAIALHGEDVAVIFERSRRSADALRVKLEKAEAEVEKLREENQTQQWRLTANSIEAENVYVLLRKAEAERDRLAEALRRVSVTDDDLPTAISIARAALTAYLEEKT